MQFHIDARGARHLCQMAQQAKARHVGARRHAVRAQDVRARLVGLQHRLQSTIDPAALGGKTGMGRKQGAGANGFGQHQHIARLHALFAHEPLHVFVDEAVDGKTQRQFLAFTAVATHQGAAGGIEHFNRTGHRLDQFVLDFAFQPWRHGGHGHGGLGLGTHGKNIPQSVVGGDFAQQIRVVNEGSEKVDALHQHLARRHAHHGGIVGGLEPDQHIRFVQRFQLSECA